MVWIVLMVLAFIVIQIAYFAKRHFILFILLVVNFHLLVHGDD